MLETRDRELIKTTLDELKDRYNTLHLDIDECDVDTNSYEGVISWHDIKVANCTLLLDIGNACWELNDPYLIHLYNRMVYTDGKINNLIASTLVDILDVKNKYNYTTLSKIIKHNDIKNNLNIIELQIKSMSIN